MSDNGKEVFQGAHLVDFTGTCDGFKQMESFGTELVKLLRSKSAKAVVLVDKATGARHNRPIVVRDHLNLTGDNPLIGHNDSSIGPRFPVVQGIYCTNHPQGADVGVTAGLKAGVNLSGEELALVRKFGADFCSVNIVPSMLVAAHAGLKVLAVGLPEGEKLSQAQMTEILDLVGAK